MKRIAAIIVIVFTLGLIMSACNSKACPAYSQADTDQTEELA